MAGESIVARSEWHDREEVIQFPGVIAATGEATGFPVGATGSDVHKRLGFLAPEEIIIDEITLKATTWGTATTTGILAISKSILTAASGWKNDAGTVVGATGNPVVTIPSGALSANGAGGNEASRVTENFEADVTQAALGPTATVPSADTRALVTLTTYAMRIHPATGTGKNNNILQRGEELYLYSTNSVTSLAGLYIVMKYRTRRK